MSKRERYSQESGAHFTDLEDALELATRNPRLREALSDYESQRRVLERILVLTPLYPNMEWTPWNYQSRFYRSTGPVEIRIKGKKVNIKVRTNRELPEADFATKSKICIFLSNESSREKETLFESEN